MTFSLTGTAGSLIMNYDTSHEMVPITSFDKKRMKQKLHRLSDKFFFVDENGNQVSQYGELPRIYVIDFSGGNMPPQYIQLTNVHIVEGKYLFYGSIFNPKTKNEYLMSGLSSQPALWELITYIEVLMEDQANQNKYNGPIIKHMIVPEKDEAE